MAQEFEKEITLLLWPLQNPYYPGGHAAVRVRAEGQVEVFNFDDKEHVRKLKTWDEFVGEFGRTSKAIEERKKWNEQRERDLQQRGRTYRMFLAHTAVTKVKLPIAGKNSPWGLYWPSFTLNSIRQGLTEDSNCGRFSSTALMASLLGSLGGDCYVPAPKAPFCFERWEVPLLERWAREIRARIDQLNAISESFKMTIGMNRLKPLQCGGMSKDDLIWPDDWKEVTKEGGFVRSPLLRKLDGLLQDYWNEGLWKVRLRIMIKILEVAARYRDERSGGKRYTAVVLLARQVTDRMRRYGGPQTTGHSLVGA